MSFQTEHACAVEINGMGILIKGQSGFGKTSLMMGLLERAKLEALNGFLIADDRVILKSKTNMLEASSPEKLAGLVEIGGFGIVKHPYRETTRIGLVVEIIADEDIERMPDQQYFSRDSISLPMISVPSRHETQSVRIVFAWLGENGCLQVE